MNHIDLLKTPEDLKPFEHKYEFIAIIGEGSFSTVYWAEDCSTGLFVAIKAITKTTSPKRILQELEILKALNGENNCIKLLEVHRHQDQVLAVFPFVRKHIDFKDFITKSTLQDIRSYMESLLIAVRHIHDKGIIHRDIKPGNFLYYYSDEAYLIDFGLAEYERPKEPSPEKPAKPMIFFNSIVTPTKPPGYYEQDTRPPMKASRTGTRGFRAPEILFKFEWQTRAVDMCVEDIDGLVEMGIIFGHSEMRKAAKLYGRVWKSNLSQGNEDGIPLEVLINCLNPNTDVDSNAIDLLKQMLDLNYETRITAKEALMHPFFTNHKTNL